MDELELGRCPQGGGLSEVEGAGVLGSTSGPVAMARVRCIHRHTFLMPRGWGDDRFAW